MIVQGLTLLFREEASSPYRIQEIYRDSSNRVIRFSLRLEGAGFKAVAMSSILVSNRWETLIELFSCLNATEGLQRLFVASGAILGWEGVTCPSPRETL
jgi:hypothetical protein